MTGTPVCLRMLYYINWSAYQGFPPLTKTKREKNANQLLTLSLALFSTMNGWQRVLFLKREFSRLLLVRKMFINEQNKTWLLGDKEFLLTCSAPYLRAPMFYSPFKINGYRN